MRFRRFLFILKQEKIRKVQDETVHFQEEEPMKAFFQEFKKFALRGNMIDMAVGVIIGGAFNGLVQSLINDIVMPLLSLVAGNLDFSNWFVTLDGSHYATLAEAQAAGVATLNYGTFLSGVLNFIIMAFVVFVMVKALNKLHKEPPKVVTTKICPHCQSEISLKATRCPFCTSELSTEEQK